MALLSNINDLFSVDSTGAIKFSTQVGTSGYVLESRGADTPPVWTDRDTGGVRGTGTENKVIRWNAATAAGTPQTIGNGPITFSSAGAAADSTFGGNATIETGINLESGTLVIKNATSDSSGLKIFQDTSDASKIHNNFNGNLEIGTNNATVLTMNGTTSTFVGNVITDGIFKVDTAPDNNILEVDQSGRKMALKTSFSSNDTDSFWALKVSTGNVSGTMIDALILKPQKATFSGNVTAPTLSLTGLTQNTTSNLFLVKD